MEIDSTEAPVAALLEAAVCIVGAGPVGLTLARTLVDRGVQVVLLESGLRRPDPRIHDLSEGDQVGDRYAGPGATRARGVGGTATVWNTIHRGAPMAKYLPLDAEDVSPRGAASEGGWPFGWKELVPHYERAQEVCGLGSFDYGVERWRDPGHPLLELGDGGLETRVYQFGPAARFTEHWPAEVTSSPYVTVVSGATATSFQMNPAGDRVTEVVWQSVTGAGGRVRADTFVLAAGAIENARLLLWLRDRAGRPTLGGDWLGRGFMEHPVDRSLELRTRDEAIARGPGFYTCHDTPDGTPVMGRIAPLPGLLHEHGLGNASIRLLLDDEPDVLRAASSRSLAHRLVPAARVRRWLGGAVRGTWGAVRRFRPVRYRLLVDLEQPPHPENRVLLADRSDALGVPRVALHWRWRPEDEARRDRVVRRLADALEASGSARVRRLDGTALDPDAHHHSGTTRMHPDAGEGVVDDTLRVHDVENLHVAGSSVFPTSGFANPTLTAVALTLRLADHLAPEMGR